jgi:hypothetical protein
LRESLDSIACLPAIATRSKIIMTASPTRVYNVSVLNPVRKERQLTCATTHLPCQYWQVRPSTNPHAGNVRDRLTCDKHQIPLQNRQVHLPPLTASTGYQGAPGLSGSSSWRQAYKTSNFRTSCSLTRSTSVAARAHETFRQGEKQ